MKKLFLMKNPDLFQGQKYLDTNHNYFEGWYFKNTNETDGISFIPGIHISDEKKNAFIQVITNDSSYYIPYDIHDFSFQFSPFLIQIGNNSFSKEGIHLDIQDEKEHLQIYGDIHYSNHVQIKTNSFQPNIMGPFSYIPFMECNHAILSMQNEIQGVIHLNKQKIDFHSGTGYIEKDWGCSFPKSYIWCQGNHFPTKKASFMLSIADIPFKIFHFRGLICIFILGDQEFKFTTYNCAKIIKYSINQDSFDITLKKGIYEFNIQSRYANRLKLMAPVKGKMEKDIFESITATITVTLKKNQKIIFSETSTNCGLEIV